MLRKKEKEKENAGYDIGFRKKKYIMEVDEKTDAIRRNKIRAKSKTDDKESVYEMWRNINKIKSGKDKKKRRRRL